MDEFRRSIAVIIGIDRYSNGISELKSAVCDADKLGELLESKHGYEVWPLINEQATIGNLKNLLTVKLPAAVGPEDRVLFYFAGHGVATDNDDGPAGYLVPQDARPEDGGTFLTMVELHEALSSLQCRHLLVVLDCCFAGAFRWSSTRFLEPEAKVVYQERFARYVADPAWQVITSAAHDQRAQDKRGEGRHSPFALALIEALSGAGDVFPPGRNGQPPGDGVITATELYLYLRNNVENFSDEGGLRQTPGFWPLKKHDKGEYVFLNPARSLSLPRAEELTFNNNPYRGLESYEEDHAKLFFGRARVERDLHRKVLVNPLTVVIGASGTGKSSLVKAGLIPRLRRLGNDRWHLPSTSCVEQGTTAVANSKTSLRALVVRPGSSPLQSLKDFLRADVELAAACNELELDFHKDPRALATLVSHWRRSRPRTRLLLVIDQLEELVTMCRHDEEHAMFLQLLSEALASHPERLRIVLTVRSDFESQFLRSTLSTHWRTSRFIVPPMTQNELRQAIENPATARVIYFESSALVDRLINEVVQMPGALPLLSFTLSEMYIKYIQSGSVDRALTDEHYKSLGGIVGSLRRRANEEFARLQTIPELQQTMRRVFLRMVAREGNELARRRVPRSELVFEDEAENERVNLVVAQLTAARLLVEGNDSEHEPYVEPAHDALVRGWDLLWTWLRQEQEQQDNLLLQRRLTQAAREWDEGGRKPGHLWDDDPRLPLVEATRATRRFWFNSLETAFVVRSAQLRKSKRRKRNTWVSTALMVLAFAAVFAGYQAVQARSERDKAVVARNDALTAQKIADDERGKAVKAKDDAVAAQKTADEERGKAITARDDANTQRDIANREKDRARAAQKQATQERDRAQSQLAESRFASAQTELDTHNDSTKALLLVSKALEAAPPKNPRRDVYQLKALYLSSRVPRVVVQIPGPLSYASLSPGREKILTQYVGQKPRVWDAVSGREHPTPLASNMEYRINTTVFDRDAQRVAVLFSEPKGQEEKAELCVWQVETGASVLRTTCLPVAPRTLETEVAFSPDSRFLLLSKTFSGAGKEIKILNLSTRQSNFESSPIVSNYDLDRPDWGFGSFKLTGLIRQPQNTFNLSPNPARNWMIALTSPAYGEYVAQVVDIESGRPPGGAQPLRHTDPISSVRFSPNAETVATVAGSERSRNFEMRLWEAATGRPIPTAAKMQQPRFFEIIEISPSGKRILTTMADDPAQRQYGSGQRVAVWDARSGAFREIVINKSEREFGITFSQDETSLVAVSADNVGRIINIATGELAAEPLRLPVPINTRYRRQSDFLLAPGNVASSLTTDGYYASWDLTSNRRLAKTVPLQRQSSTGRSGPEFVAATFTVDQQAVLTETTHEKTIQFQLWSVDTGEPHWAQPLVFPSAEIRLSMSLDGKRFATAVKEGYPTDKVSIVVWDMATGRAVSPRPLVVEFFFTFEDFALSRTGDRIAVAWSAEQAGPGTIRDHKVQQWNVESGAKLTPHPIAHKFPAQFVQDGVHYLVGFGSDFTIYNIENRAESSGQLHFENDSGFQALMIKPLLNQAVDIRVINKTDVQIVLPSTTLLMKTSPVGTSLHNLGTGSALVTPSVAHPNDWGFATTFSPDGKWVVTGNPFEERPRENFYRNINFTLSETATGQPLWDNIWHESTPLAAVFSADSGRLITFTEQGLIRTWAFRPPLERKPKWFTQMGSALTGVKLSGERSAVRLTQEDYGALRGRFFDQLRRDARNNSGACFILSQFENNACVVKP